MWAEACCKDCQKISGLKGIDEPTISKDDSRLGVFDLQAGEKKDGGGSSLLQSGALFCGHGAKICSFWTFHIWM